MSAPYPTRQLGKNGPFVSAIGFGAMGVGAFYGESDENNTQATLTRAADLGVTFWDTSDYYGTSETSIGNWFAKTGRRSEIFLATKFGGRDERPGGDKQKSNSKPSYILHQVQASLKALQTDYIDLYYQHRVDPEVPIEVVMETLRPAVESGTIKYLGLSECSLDTLRRAKAVPGVGEKLIAVQMEFSPFELYLEKTGFAAAAREMGVAIVAYSPLCRGLVSGRYRSRADLDPTDYRLIVMPRFSEENFPKNLPLVDKLQEISSQLGATSSQVALAWILAEHPDFFPIPGCKTPGRLEENAKAARLDLPAESVKTIRKFVEEAEAQLSGTRYPPQYLAMLSGDCIPMSEWKGE